MPYTFLLSDFKFILLNIKQISVGPPYTCILSVFVIEYVLMHFIRYLKSNGCIWVKKHDFNKPKISKCWA